LATQIITKYCPRCKCHKRVCEFTANRSKKDGLASYCCVCARVWILRYRKTDRGREAHKVASREWRRTPAGKRYIAKNLEKFRDCRRRYKLKAKYGITEEDYKRLLFQQNGRCAICQTEKPGGKWPVFHVDHDHKTGAVRGLLCVRCNRGLAIFGDCIEGFLPVIRYLERAAANSPIHGKKFFAASNPT
jgi:hypothetical protein